MIVFRSWNLNEYNVGPLGPWINQIVWCFSLDYPTTRHCHLWTKCKSITERVNRWMVPLFLPIIITAEDAASDLAGTSAELSRDKALVLGSRGQGSAGLLRLQAAAALWASIVPSMELLVADIWTTTRMGAVLPRLCVGRNDRLHFIGSNRKDFSPEQ